MSSLLSLPDEVLKLVLSHVPRKRRLGSCCLVHTRLHAAAVAATERLKIGQIYSELPPQRVQSLLSWLSAYGQHLTRLEMRQPQLPLTQLPCHNLLRLDLFGGSIQLGPTADGRPGVVEGITQLTRLEVVTTRVVDGPVVDSLSRLAHLRHLSWCPTGGVRFSRATLPRLQQLTYLSAHLLPKSIIHIGALTSLRNLGLGFDLDSTVSPSRVSSLVLPPSLTRLELDTDNTDGDAMDDPGWNSLLLRCAPAGLRELHVEWSHVDGLELPLACMSRLQCLTELVLGVSPAHVVAWPPPGPVYRALMASRSLASVHLAVDLPGKVWPFVFGATHRLPHLTYLGFDGYRDEPDAPWAFGAADLARLVRCCPSLCELHCIRLQPGPHVSELHKLTALTDLNAHCGAGDIVGAVRGLAAATQLQSLCLSLAAPLPLASLLPLTSLTSLTDMTYTTRGKNVRRWFTPAGHNPGVWLQLLEHCAAGDPRCQPTALRNLAQQLAEQRSLSARQQQQLAEQRALAARQQQQLAEQRALTVRQQQQLAVQAQAAAEQAARIAVLEGQQQQQEQVAAEQGAEIATLKAQLLQVLQLRL